MRLYDLGGDGTEVVHDKILTIPNLLSFGRLLVLPYLVWVIARGDLLLGVVIAGAFAATDWLDGYIARRFDQVTKLGKMLDPLADRLFVASVVIALALSGLLPWWVLFAIVGRDLALLVVGGLFLRGRQMPPVSNLGKTATFVLMFAFLPIFIAGVLGEPADPHEAWFLAGMATLVFALLLYWATGVDYTRRILASEPGDDD